jgi:CTP:molybdopterin cytidylyltransferase MocA
LLIDRSLFDALGHADPRVGAKPLIRAQATAVGDVEVADEGAFCDIDTPEDYERALRIFAGGDRAARGERS